MSRPCATLSAIIASTILLTACNTTSSNDTSPPSTSGDSAVIMAMRGRIDQLMAENQSLRDKLKTEGPAAKLEGQETLPDALPQLKDESAMIAFLQTRIQNINKQNEEIRLLLKNSGLIELVKQPATPSAHDIKTKLTDIHDYKNTADMVRMQILGIFDPIGTTFAPKQPAIRRDFVRWLVKSTNLMLAKNGQASKCLKINSKNKSIYSDVKDNDKDLPYIQALSNYGVGLELDNHTFKPDKPITRAEMFAIKGVLDKLISDGKTDTLSASKRWYAEQSYSDATVVPEPLAGGMQLAQDSGEIARIYGAMRMVKPNDLVLRWQAAMCAASIGAHREYSIDKLHQ